MKKILISLCIICSMLFGIQTVQAADYSKISTNAKIVSALEALDNIGRRDVIAILKGYNATKKPIRVMFRDFKMYGYGDCEALTVKTKSNGLLIYINAEHKGASAECIACLLAHESQHHTFTNSKVEELRAWMSEANAWNEFLRRNKNLAYATEPLAKRENYIVKLKDKKGVQGIRNLIATNPVYAGLN